MTEKELREKGLNGSCEYMKYKDKYRKMLGENNYKMEKIDSRCAWCGYEDHHGIFYSYSSGMQYKGGHIYDGTCLSFCPACECSVWSMVKI